LLPPSSTIGCGIGAMSHHIAGISPCRLTASANKFPRPSRLLPD
jgi:hypothetical protein